MKVLRSPLSIVWAGSLVTALASVVTLAPVANAATTTTTVSSAVGQVISLLSSNGTVNINTTPTASGVQTTASDTVTVSTNDSAGYTLQIAESGASSTLTAGANTIPASSGTQAVPVAMAVNTWGYAVQSLGGFNTSGYAATSNVTIGSQKFAAVPATGSPNTIKTTAVTASNDTTTVWYGVAANTSQPSGTYTNSVTYTATAN